MNIEIDEKTRLKRIGRLEKVPKSAKGLFERVFFGKASPRARIKAFCLECNGFDRAGIRDCSAVACPIWKIRPFQKKAKKAVADGNEGGKV